MFKRFSAFNVFHRILVKNSLSVRSQVTLSAEGRVSTEATKRIFVFPGRAQALPRS